MRLLRAEPNGSFRLTDVRRDKPPRYAILSHTWQEGQEVEFQDLVGGSGQSKAGFKKIKFCGEQAAKDGLQYFWVDTCCIDRSSSAELAEAINSMFRWYSNAARCYVYLSDFDSAADVDSQSFLDSRWHRRGWTLQELLAPKFVDFFTCTGEKLGDKHSLALQIHTATGVPVQALRQAAPLSLFSVEERMSWAAQRETTVAEDAAYCLLGIFQVFLSPIYGEGREHALRRLRDEISARHTGDTSQLIEASTADRLQPCLANLNPTNQARFLEQALRRSKDGCRWIFQSEKYKTWLESKQSSLLWITAKAGCGKTTLAAHILQTISSKQTSEAAASPDQPETVLLFFFFQKSSLEALGTGIAALRTAISQLARQVPAASDILLKQNELLSAKGDFEWSSESLLSVFEAMLEELSSKTTVYLIFDALDECAGESRGMMLNLLESLAEDNTLCGVFPSSNATMKILVTSRPDGELIDHMSGSPTIEVTESDTAKDIQALIHHRIGAFGKQRRLAPEVTERIIHFLESNARGMFIWVVLIIKDLERRDQPLSDEAIASKLSSIPLSLIDTYEEVFRNVPIERRQDMWRIVRWLLFWKRNLTVEELEMALCLEKGMKKWYDFTGDLKFLCGSLIRADGPQDEVRFLHQTAFDFVEAFSQNLSDADTGGLDLKACAAHEHLAALCVEYSLRKDIQSEVQKQLEEAVFPVQQPDVDNFFAQHKLLRYTIESWAFHTQAIGSVSTRISRILLSSARGEKILLPAFAKMNSECCHYPRLQSLIHIAAYYNITWLLKQCLFERPDAVNDVNMANCTPLVWGSEMGSTDCVRILLDAGADPNHYEFDGWSALHWAARNGHVDIAELLLERGAKPSHRDGKGHSPLEWALDRQHWPVAKLLFSTSAGLEVVDGFELHFLSQMKKPTSLRRGRLGDKRVDNVLGYDSSFPGYEYPTPTDSP